MLRCFRSIDSQCVDRECVKAITAHARLDIIIREIARAGSPGLAGGTYPLQVSVRCSQSDLNIVGIEAQLF